MFRRILASGVLLTGLLGCATPPTDPGAAPVPWLDQSFDYSPSLVRVDKEELFRLPPDVMRKLAAYSANSTGSTVRMQQLVSMIFGPDKHSFGYAAGHSTTASETWERRQGDCLSLTVLTYATARALGLQGDMQEVQSPMTFDRVGRFDVLNEHVNVYFPRAYHGNIEAAESRDVVIDFDPDLSPGRRGRALTEGAILARYYNNIAVEHLAQDQPVLAYAHFRAALASDPGYAAAYGNLAVLYSSAGRMAEAEQVLRVALQRAPTSDLPLRALHQLLVDQGRLAEARDFAAQLDARRASDPYYWTGLGLRYLQDGEPGRAITPLLRARAIAPGFTEVRRYLAVAYARSGDQKLANSELETLASLGERPGKMSALGKILKQ